MTLLLIAQPLLAVPKEDIAIIEQLIETTKKNLESQQKLLTLLVEFNAAKELFLINSESGKYATALVKKGVRLYQHLEKENLSHLFSQDLLTEIAFFNQIGKQPISRG